MGSIPGLGRSGEGNSNPLQYSCLENPMDRGAWQATVHGVAKSQTQLSTHALEEKLNSLSSVLSDLISGSPPPRSLASSLFCNHTKGTPPQGLCSAAASTWNVLPPEKHTVLPLLPLGHLWDVLLQVRSSLIYTMTTPPFALPRTLHPCYPDFSSKYITSPDITHICLWSVSSLWKVSFKRTQMLFCSLLYSLHPEQAHSRCSVNVCWMNIQVLVRKKS